jgi:hypothetical protein
MTMLAVDDDFVRCRCCCFSPCLHSRNGWLQHCRNRSSSSNTCRTREPKTNPNVSFRFANGTLIRVRCCSSCQACLLSSVARPSASPVDNESVVHRVVSDRHTTKHIRDAIDVSRYFAIQRFVNASLRLYKSIIQRSTFRFRIRCTIQYEQQKYTGHLQLDDVDLASRRLAR